MQQNKQTIHSTKKLQKKPTAKLQSINNNVSDIVKQFETKKPTTSSFLKSKKRTNQQTGKINVKITNGCSLNKKENRNFQDHKTEITSKEILQIENHKNMSDSSDCCVNESENIATDGNLMEIEQTEVNDNHKNYSIKSNNSRICQQLQVFQRIFCLLLNLPFFSSINCAGLTTLTCTFFLPRFLCQSILYPIFRLVFGTLYPAYASYKAVRSKDVKDYVS